MDRRTFLSLTAPAVALRRPAATRVADQQLGTPENIGGSRQRFLALPGNKSFQIQTGGWRGSWRDEYRPNAPLVVGSAIKTFLLTIDTQPRLKYYDPENT
jgi:hypothetical protein